jgi:hypothetical protein
MNKITFFLYSTKCRIYHNPQLLEKNEKKLSISLNILYRWCKESTKSSNATIVPTMIVKEINKPVGKETFKYVNTVKWWITINGLNSKHKSTA